VVAVRSVYSWTPRTRRRIGIAMSCFSGYLTKSRTETAVGCAWFDRLLLSHNLAEFTEIWCRVVTAWDQRAVHLSGKSLQQRFDRIQVEVEAFGYILETSALGHFRE
jgi:hypothetical protein